MSTTKTATQTPDLNINASKTPTSIPSSSSITLYHFGRFNDFHGVKYVVFTRLGFEY